MERELTAAQKTNLFTGWQRSGASAHAVARSWVDAAIASGLDPRLVQNSLTGEDPGEWRIATRKKTCEDGIGPVPEDHFDEIFLILEQMGRVSGDTILKCWHGEVMADDCGPRALALRLRLAWRCLNEPQIGFWNAWQIIPGLVSDDPDASHDLSHLVELAASDIQRRHGIPEEWLFFGTPEEIEPMPNPR